MGPVSSTGRAMMASLQQAMQQGMPTDQAIAYVKSMAQQGVAPLTDLYAMLNQFQRLKQPQAQAPQTPPTIRDQINMAAQQRAAQDVMMGQGLGGVDAGSMENPQFAGGGIVAFQAGGPSQLTPSQIALQQERQLIAEQLLRGPVSITDPNYRVPDYIVDSKGRLVPKERIGEVLRQLRIEKEGRGISPELEAREGVKSPMKREVEAYKRAQGLGATPEAAAADVVEPAKASRGWAAPKEGPGIFKRMMGSESLKGTTGKLGAAGLAGLTGYEALRLSDVPTEDLRKYYGYEGEGSKIGNLALRARAFAEEQLPDEISMGPMLSTFRTPIGTRNPITELLAQRTERGATPAAPAATAATAAVRPPASTTPAGGPSQRDQAGGAGRIGGTGETGGLSRLISDERRLLSDISKGLEDGSREEQEFQRLNAIAQRDKTGPYSEVFTKSDEMLRQRLAESEERKKSAFGRALVNAGLAMAAQASKGGQPGSELQKFLASAVAGLGGYSEAQQLLKKEADQSQREYDDLMLRVETAREGSRGELRGAARQRVAQLENRADQLRGNIQRVQIAQAQLNANREIAGIRAAASAAGASNRARASIYDLARKMVADQMRTNPMLMTQMNSSDPNVANKAQQVYNDMLNKQVAVIMGSPQLMAAAGAGQPEAEGEDYSDLLSSADAIVGGQ